MEVDSNLRVIFFDGHCGLCNGFVDFILKHDHQRLFLFAPLQSEVAKFYLSEDLRKDLSTIVFFDQGTTCVRSEAAIKILAGLGSGWQLMSIFLLLPRVLRDMVYKLIARNRYRWFGRDQTCRIPTSEERERFLLE